MEEAKNKRIGVVTENNLRSIFVFKKSFFLVGMGFLFLCWSVS
ncbi:hypothetical protein LEP1GSC103_1301 [Leptospira borgpetersenii serovar Javanica str. UI 09931]|uniref:Uncharacterized protein n=1 Tax=Leptospira borgpetersenii serovar Javanica str. UI 09931 TaxID=1049767 RepID=A0AAV3J6Z3_LEPBO|nr:hypothetical protein LEP1GSC101_2189 [Leptospira borgpetersenii str. UI 09149]EMN57713.1 hypothetical protein LEP1GSC090_0508 [Leptospira borgpetersenii serovar Javanica str. MK146]EPG56285.1 hypothetical protein LEP1GSC103_1301 [Leptospira borgpetersenii serovar Javanica str. UI 09931]